ncbi:terminase small subunit [Aminithiophilus ramosus]|uniref:Terminase small subunit n=1 Tax=Aminithiophilus ramosus TaxID=3029084 RepID=A0A9Q7EXV1_9BACT|nr:terminase small subunit [Aminithiophilus ramosus]QTX32860.1 terminase small subunit [Aminithiophilus ramosus]
MGLTPKQRAFVEIYDGNTTRAAIAAGYSQKWAGSNGDKLMKHPAIREALEKRISRKINSIVADREERQSFWSAVMRDEERDLKDRLRASELLARSEGDFLDRIENRTLEAPSIVVNFIPSDGSSNGRKEEELE